jgi:hypothetical protein
LRAAFVRPSGNWKLNAYRAYAKAKEARVVTVFMWIGAGVLALCGVACGINLGSRAASGAEKVWSPQIFGWAIGFHGAVGVAALVLMMNARG